MTQRSAHAGWALQLQTWTVACLSTPLLCTHSCLLTSLCAQLDATEGGNEDAKSRYRIPGFPTIKASWLGGGGHTGVGTRHCRAVLHPA